MSEERRAYWLAYIEQLAGLMGLGAWTFTISEEAAPKGCNCQITFTHNRNLGEVKFRTGWDKRAPTDQRQSIVHELIHAQFAHTYIYCETSIKPFMTEREYEVWLKAFTDRYELETDAAASTAWARMLPLPPGVAGEGKGK